MYHDILLAVMVEELACERLPTNTSDKYAVAVVKLFLLLKKFSSMLEKQMHR